MCLMGVLGTFQGVKDYHNCVLKALGGVKDGLNFVPIEAIAGVADDVWGGRFIIINDKSKTGLHSMLPAVPFGELCLGVRQENDAQFIEILLSKGLIGVFIRYDTTSLMREGRAEGCGLAWVCCLVRKSNKRG